MYVRVRETEVQHVVAILSCCFRMYYGIGFAAVRVSLKSVDKTRIY